MTDEGRFTTRGWDADGTATLVAVGADARAALEAGLRGTLRLIAPPPAALMESQAIPLQGSGADLASLFRELVEDLIATMDDFSGVPVDIALDGVLRRDEGGYRGWGYAFADPAFATIEPGPVVVARVAVSDDGEEGVVVRATLRRL